MGRGVAVFQASELCVIYPSIFTDEFPIKPMNFTILLE
jgi:hypothetical protein